MIGCGAAFASSTRQKINSKSSTEAELMGVTELMGQVLCKSSFLEAQGHVVYKGGALFLAENGKASSS